MSDLTILDPIAQGDQFRIFDAEDLVACVDDREQAEYAVMLLENGGLGDLTGLDRLDVESMLYEFVLRVRCEDCDAIVFVGETSPSGRCADCQS